MDDVTAVERVAREQAFHDERFAVDDDGKRERFYEYVDGARTRLAEATNGFGAGDRVLELGVGLASTGWDLARRGAHVVAIDISPVAIERAQATAKAEGLDTIEFRVMNAEQLDFGARSFDGVIGSGILHHLDLDRVFAEIRRVLKPSGQAVFYEPLGHNPLINWHRKHSPEQRTVDEHPIVRADFSTARRHFATVEASMHHCTVLGCALMPGRLALMARPVLDRVDSLITRIPGLRWQSWITVIELSGPL